MTVLADTTAPLKPSARHLVSDASFATAVHLVQRCNPELHDDMATFVAAAAANRTPGLTLRPSRVVDEGWHARSCGTRRRTSPRILLGKILGVRLAQLPRSLRAEVIPP